MTTSPIVIHPSQALAPRLQFPRAAMEIGDVYFWACSPVEFDNHNIEPEALCYFETGRKIIIKEFELDEYKSTAVGRDIYWIWFFLESGIPAFASKEIFEHCARPLP